MEIFNIWHIFFDRKLKAVNFGELILHFDLLLKMAIAFFNISRKHNTNLSELFQELLAKVAEVRGGGNLVQVDPITKLGQVKLEK